MRNKFKMLRSSLYYLGLLLSIFSIISIIPIFVAVYYNENPKEMLAFFIPSILFFIIGLSSIFIFEKQKPTASQGIMLCSFGWIVVSMIGAIPFMIILKASFIDSFFEAVSGFTTTGITMFTNLKIFPKSLIFWRSLIQWIGGLGILTFFIALFSSEGSHNVISAESHKINAKRIVPNLQRTVKFLWIIYSAFTFLIFLLLYINTSEIFNSLNHALTTLSTGGFSPFDASIAHYSNINHPNFKAIEYIIIFGMFLGGTNFFIHYRLLNFDFKALWDNLEMKTWLKLLLFFTLIIFLERLIKHHIFRDILSNPFHTLQILEENFRKILFQVLSVITTTGFGTEDLTSSFFGSLSRQLFLIMMVIGGCVGSTGGGFKVMRVAILFKLIKREIKKTCLPTKAINYVKVDNLSYEKDEIFRISAIFFMWILLLIFGGLITALFSNFDGYTSFSGMFSALGNIGPSFFSVEEMTNLHPVIKITYIFGMLAGRLEILPIIALINRKIWLR